MSIHPSTRALSSVADLAPEIFRQRLVIEGLVSRTISAEQIVGYLSRLSQELDMIALIEPVTHRSDRYGWAGWIHWETSGAHFYAWEAPRRFFSVDIYTCKPFDVTDAIEYTADFFDADDVTARTC